uniref:RWP-RK domain-containing protein n=1 Tax=Hemiselmis andersenii TaxID=464988 RepID=A0A6U2GSB0_HEMAN|mmetsp:Transcript_37998/g.88721  ORF Transcript_37998/g.88721 Transcript_37998/m.88721 type:complete len:346 (+) Transcript_37998:288-1325(+)
MGQVDLQELSKYFKMPEKEVAKELGVCLTTLKKIARSHGINRWPYRKVKSLDRKLRKLDVVAGGARAGVEGADVHDAPWSHSSSGSSNSTSGTHTPTSSEASIATTPRVVVKAEGTWTPGAASPTAPPSIPEEDLECTATCSGASAARPSAAGCGAAAEALAFEVDDVQVLPACGEFDPAGRSEGGADLVPFDVEMQGACSNVTSCDHDGAPPAAPAGEHALRGGSPEPEPLTDEEIVAMLADCAGQRNAPRSGRCSPAASRHHHYHPDPKQMWEELPARGLSDVEIMSGLAQCVAEREDEEGGDAFLHMHQEAGTGQHHNHSEALGLDDFGQGDLGVADFLAVA